MNVVIVITVYKIKDLIILSSNHTDIILFNWIIRMFYFILDLVKTHTFKQEVAA
jgi:hypothetical protein